jgi:hypothetical protein
MPEYFTSIVIAVIVTTLVTPPLLKLFMKDEPSRQINL